MLHHHVCVAADLFVMRSGFIVLRKHAEDLSRQAILAVIFSDKWVFLQLGDSPIQVLVENLNEIIVCLNEQTVQESSNVWTHHGNRIELFN